LKRLAPSTTVLGGPTAFEAIAGCPALSQATARAGTNKRDTMNISLPPVSTAAAIFEAEVLPYILCFTGEQEKEQPSAL
jgi:hypothetical protein